MDEVILETPWLTEEAHSELDESNLNRLEVILKDLVTMPHLRYTYVISRNGVQLTSALGPMGKRMPDSLLHHNEYFHLATITENYLENLEHPAPAHVTIDMEDEMLFVGSAGPLILVAGLDGNAVRGYMSMKLTKRISHLRRLFRTLDSGGNYGY